MSPTLPSLLTTVDPVDIVINSFELGRTLYGDRRLKQRILDVSNRFGYLSLKISLFFSFHHGYNFRNTHR